MRNGDGGEKEEEARLSLIEEGLGTGDKGSDDRND